jgi:peptidoglycan/xylan/chitin deacetylase (PgdA/CDA1 family)
MIGRIPLKRALKRVAGCVSVASSVLPARHSVAAACILVYHRVADIGFVDPRRDDWNVTPARLDSHVQALVEFGSVVPLHQLPALLGSGQVPPRPWICLTFDDGFANFYHQALPVLQRYRAPATLFVPTNVIGSSGPMSFDRWAADHHDRVSPEVWRAITWEELEKCLDSGIVTLGSHSHLHLNGLRCPPDQFLAEAASSREILVVRFGADQIQSYAYPYGSRRLGQVPDRYIEAVRQSGYSLAVTTDLGLATADGDSLAWPRVEAHQVDGPAVMRAKASGRLAGYYFTDRLRSGHRK